MRRNEFIKELDIIVQEDWRNNIFPMVEKTDITSGTFNINKEKTDEVLKKYIDKDIEHVQIRLSISNGRGKIQYCYKGIELKPVSYWSKPVGCRHVSELQMIEQAILQDTYAPDIKFLQDPIKEEDDSKETNK